MDAQYISYKDTHAFSEPLNRYLNHDKLLSDFINKHPTKSGFDAIIKEKKPFAHRKILCSVLAEQYQQIKNDNELSSSTSNNLTGLLSENTFTITTGHQLNIFTGPLYFIYKIITAIKLADDLKKLHPDKNFVPVYWMASEDHDFEEVNHTYIANKKILWSQSQQGATGKINTESIAGTLKDYLSVLGISDKANQFADMVSDAYTKAVTLADATRRLVNRLFSDFGLVIIDADDKRLKEIFKPVIAYDIIEENSFKLIEKQIGLLKETGIDAQVSPREINFFYVDNHLRERIVKEGEKYKVLNTEISFSKEEILNEIELFPEKFSPNVVMRPVYQELILPNIAYVGGGAEIIYWLQLKPVFDFYNAQFPVLIPRNSALLLKKEMHQQLEKLNISKTDLFLSIDELQKNWVKKHSKHELSINDENREFDAVFEKLTSKTKAIDLTLAPSTAAVKARLYHALKNLEKKILRAEKRNNFEALERIRKIKQACFPINGLQERSENFGLFYVNYQGDFLKGLYHHFDPLSFEFSILVL